MTDELESLGLSLITQHIIESLEHFGVSPIVAEYGDWFEWLGFCLGVSTGWDLKLEVLVTQGDYQEHLLAFTSVFEVDCEVSDFLFLSLFFFLEEPDSFAIHVLCFMSHQIY